MTFDRHALRDLIRRKLVDRHRARHGNRYRVRGVEVTVPPISDIGALSALAKGSYEQEEARLIEELLPADLPVVELGGSLGIISALIRSRLEPAIPHVVLEANPEIVSICEQNATGSMPGATMVVNAALAYGRDEIRLTQSGGYRGRRIAPDADEGVAVPTRSLADLLALIGNPAKFVLICDVEGAELDLIRQEADILPRIELCIIEVHPHAYARGPLDKSEILAALTAAGLSPIAEDGDVLAYYRK